MSKKDRIDKITQREISYNRYNNLYPINKVFRNDKR